MIYVVGKKHIATLQLQARVIFQTDYDQYVNDPHNGQEADILRVIDRPDVDHDAEVLPMYAIRFGDGTEIDAWPEELTRLEPPCCECGATDHSCQNCPTFQEERRL